MLSICCITYNQAPFIRQTLDGFLSQKTDFDVEIVIGDDYSTDGTREILQEYQSRYPKLFRLLLPEKNTGMQANFMATMSACRQKYVALCEGDDYWTDPLKLQKQVTFLEKNQDFSICFHRAHILYESGITTKYPEINKTTPEETALDDIVKGNYIHTPTVVFRNEIKGQLPDWFKQAYPCDWPLHTINATFGKIAFLPGEMAVYRVHKGGVHSTQSSTLQKSLTTIRNMAIELKKRNFDSQSRYLMQTYRHNYAYIYGIAFDRLKSKSRLQRSLILLRDGNYKMKIFFWLPLVFGHKTETVWKSIARKAGSGN